MRLALFLSHRDLPEPGRRISGTSVDPRDRKPPNSPPVIDAVSPLATKLATRRVINAIKGRDVFRDYLAGGVDIIGVSTYPYEGRTLRKLYRNLRKLRRSVERSPYAILVTRPSDFQKAVREGKLGVFFHNQGAPGFGEPLLRGGFWGSILDHLKFLPSPRPAEPNDLATFKKRGVMVTGLAYNQKNRLGAGFSQGNEEYGLTELGREYIRASVKNGIAIDLCHLNEKTALDAAKYITALGKPPLLTHVDCYELRPISRNLSGTDDVIRAIAKGNGVIGVSALAYSLGKPADNHIGQIIKHIDHIIKVGGVDHVGLGLDYWTAVAPYSPGWMQALRDWWEVRRGWFKKEDLHPCPNWMPLGMETPLGIHNLEDAIRRRYKPDVADKILGGNMQRVLNEWWQVKETT